MSKDELIEKVLREACIFPPSVLDSHYSDQPEMAKGEIIKKTLDEMGMLSLSEQDPQFSDEVGYISIVITSLTAGSRPTPESSPVALSATSTHDVVIPATRLIRIMK